MEGAGAYDVLADVSDGLEGCVSECFGRLLVRHIGGQEGHQVGQLVHLHARYVGHALRRLRGPLRLGAQRLQALEAHPNRNGGDGLYHMRRYWLEVGMGD